MNTNAVVAAGAGEHFNGDLMSPLRAQMGLSANPLGLTVIRIRGRFQMLAVSAATVGLCGIRMYTRGGDNAGQDLLDVDGPSRDPHADWMAFETMYNDSGESQERTFDVRSMRKLEEVSSSLVISFDTPGDAGGTFRYTVSVLVALP